MKSFRAPEAVALLFASAIAFSPGPCYADDAKDLYDKIVQLQEHGGELFNQVLADRNASPAAVSRYQQQVGDNMQQLLDAQNSLESLAKSGDLEGQYYMGMQEVYYGRKSLAVFQSSPNISSYASLAQESFTKAVEWFKPLALKGDPAAQWQLGILYANGQGVNQSNSNAIEWWYKAAQAFSKQGDREDALTLYDQMKKLDDSNPLVAKLKKLLFP